jgi:hypothetical protein
MSTPSNSIFPELGSTSLSTIQRDVVDGFDMPDHPLQQAPPDGEILLELCDAEQRTQGPNVTLSHGWPA